MTSNATTQTEALLLSETKDGIATLTLNRPGQFNALSTALIDELQSTLRPPRRGPDRPRGRARGEWPWILRGARSQGDSGHGRRARRRVALRALQPHDDDHHDAAAAGHREGARPRDGGRLSARRHLRPRGGIHGGDLRHAGREHRRVLFHAQRRARPGGRPQARHGDAAHRRDRSAPRVPTRSDSSIASCRPRRSMWRSRRWRDCIASKSSAAIASGKQVFYRQLELSLGDAYGLAGHAIACDFFTEDGKEGVDAFLGKRAPRWKHRHETI